MKRSELVGLVRELMAEQDNSSVEMEKALKAGLAQLKEDVDVTPTLSEMLDEEERLDESMTGLIVGGLLAAPKLLTWLGKAVNAIAKFFKGGEETEIGKGIEHAGHKWEGLYVKSIAFVLKKMRKSKLGVLYTEKDGSIDEERLYAASQIIYGVILAVAAGNAVSGALSTNSAIVQGLESVFGGTKAVEIVQISRKVFQALS